MMQPQLRPPPQRRSAASQRRTRTLSPAALQWSPRSRSSPAYSPIVLAGIVRSIEFALIAAGRRRDLFAYVVPRDGFDWHYVVADRRRRGARDARVPGRRHLQIQAFRSHVQQYSGSPSRGRWCSCSSFGVTFFAKVGDQFSRVWLGSWYVVGLVALLGFRLALFVLVRRWTREGRLERRAVIVGGGDDGEALIRALEAQRDTDVRIIGMFDDRDDERSPAMVAGLPKLGTVADLVEFARRTRVDLVIVSLPLTAENARAADAEASSGCCRSTSGSSAHIEQAALPPARLFLCRQRAGARHLRQADRRLGRRDQVAVRQGRRRASR